MNIEPVPSAPPFAPVMPPIASDGVGGLRVLATLRRNGLSAFPGRCLSEPVIRLRMPGRALVIASAPDAIRHILQTYAADFRRLPAGRRILGPIAGRGLLTSEGEAWRRQRKAMAPAFTPRTVPVLAGHIVECTEATCARLEAGGGPIDLLAEMQRLSLDIASVTMFSIEAEAFGAELRAMVTTYMATIGRPFPSDFLLPAGVPTLLSWRRARFRQRWQALIGGIVARRRAQDRNDHADGAPRDLFDLMASAHGDGAEDLLADEVATMIVAGHETTALTLFWASLLLAQVPRWQEAVATEARGRDLSVAGAAASLPHLAITRAVVQEALRLYPPAFMTARQATRTQTVCGIEVPAGAVVLMPLFMLHRDPTLWPAPETFDPARFLTGTEPDRYAYLPFGLGPNVCIGSQLAMTEAVLVLARLVAGSRIRLASERPVLPVGVLSTRPDHAPDVVLERRDAH